MIDFNPVKRLLLLWWCCLAFSLTLMAQPATFRFDHIQHKNGLSQAQAYWIFQDHLGYIWIGTQDGLNRFDGTQIKIFKNNPFDSTSLTHNWVWAVNEDDTGDMWVGTFQGLCRYIRQEDRFVQYFHNSDDTTSISGNRPNNILKDKKGRMWISSWGKGLNLYDPKTDAFRRFLHDEKDVSSLSDNAVRTMFCDHNGVVWIGTWNGGLNRVVEDARGIHFQRFEQQREYGLEGGNRITSIAEDQQGYLWIASYESGVIRLHPDRNHFERVPGYASDDINKIICDSRGNVWIGSNNGLYYHDGVSGVVTHFQHDPRNPSGISSNVIYAIAEDRQGIVWISGNGLDKYDPRKNVFHHYRHNPADENSLSQNVVWSFYEDAESNIWIGLESGPISIFDPRTQRFKHLTVADDRGNVASNIHRIVEDKSGTMWLASFNNGLVRYDRRSGKARFYFGDDRTPLGAVAHVDEILLDEDGSLWVSSNERGLFHLSAQRDEVVQYKHDPNDVKSIGSNFINALYQDRQGNLWVGFWGGGLSILDKQTNTFRHYQYDRKNKNGLSDQVVTGITQQDDSIFWICTHTGLNKLNIKTNRFTHFFEKDKLANNVVYNMLRDDQGHYWISSNGGLSRFDPVRETFKNYTEEDGLQSNEFNANASLRSKTGAFYFGGVNGFNVFYPADIAENVQPEQVVIQQIKVHDVLQRPDASLNLSYDQNYLTFQFAALEFSAPEKVRYAFKLDGFNEDWVEAGSRREAVYTNLDPGHYTFRVKATNPDGIWSAGDTTIEIDIQPPFWRTWWFTACVVLLTVGLVYSIHRYRLRQSLEVERLRNKIASDLHDEVGSSLTRISIYADLLQNGTVEADRHNYLHGISNMSREIVGTMSDIVWSIDNRSDSLGALVLRMKDFASEILQARNIDFHFSAIEVDEQRILDPALKQNLYLIFKEAINNAVKHAAATAVSVTLTNRNGEFVMSIHDNGKGFVSDGHQRGNGLRNMERRAKAIEASFSLHSAQGTTITICRRTL